MRIPVIVSDERRFGEKKRVCESRSGTYWESSMCRCMSKSVATRGLDYQNIDCKNEEGDQNFLEHSIQRGFDMFQYIMIGAGLTLSIFLFAATFHYKKKYENLKTNERNKSEKNYKKTTNPSHAPTRGRSRHKDTNGRINNNVAKSSSRKEMEDLEQLLSGVALSSGGGDLYHEQYNEHGVKIERQVDDSELAKYIHHA